ncbi:hypothetical protein ACJX0J_038899, partial [Zea mays]
LIYSLLLFLHYGSTTCLRTLLDWNWNKKNEISVYKYILLTIEGTNKLISHSILTLILLLGIQM